MSTRIETDTNGDVVLAFVNREHDDTYEAQIFVGHDGVTVVQIDTPAHVGRVRINLNDSPIWDGDPDADEPPGAARDTAVADEEWKALSTAADILEHHGYHRASVVVFEIAQRHAEK